MLNGLHRARALAAGLVWLLAAAAAVAQPPAAPVRDAGAGRVIVAPPNLGVRATPEVAPGIEPVWRELLGHFRERGEPVAMLEREGAAELWADAMAQARADGRGDELHAVYARFALFVAEQGDFARLVLPSLVTRAARLRGRSASWDGARRRVDVPGAERQEVPALPEGGIQLERSGATGELAAASLHVAVFGPDGALLAEGTGGLVLLQELRLDPELRKGELAVAPRRNAWSSADELREGIAHALSERDRSEPARSGPPVSEPDPSGPALSEPDPSGPALSEPDPSGPDLSEPAPEPLRSPRGQPRREP